MCRNGCLALLTSFFIFFAALDSISIAESGDAEFPFAVEPVYPGNQIERDAGYWYVDAVKGKSQELSANVSNTGSNEITVILETADCYTSTDGDLCYITGNTSPSVLLTDERFMLSKRISLSQRELKLKPGEKKQAAFSVTFPDIDEGEALGAVRFSVTQKGRDTGSTENGTQLNLNIRNAITLTVRLRYKFPANIPVPGISVGDAGFNTETGALYITLGNMLPVINRDIKGSYGIYDSQDNRLFGGSFRMVRMAPFSELRYPVKWSYPNAAPGSYKVSVLTENAKNPETRTVQLRSGDVEIIASESPPAAAPPVPGIAADNKILIYGGWIMFGITLLAFLIYFAVRRRRRRE